MSAASPRGAQSSTAKPPNEWVQYTDSLEDSLIEAKEYAAAMTTKNDNQAKILEELREQRAQTKLVLEQNKKLMKLLAKGMMISGTSNTSDGELNGRPAKQKQKMWKLRQDGIS